MKLPVQTIRGWFLIPPMGTGPGEVAPVRPEHPCGVRDCFEVQSEVSRDDRDITVECPVHGCHTTWPLVKETPREQHVIRVQDGWHQHGTKGPQPRR